jgi:hypothetical protein
MNQEWLEPLKGEEEEAAIREIGGWILQKKMEAPAILALEMHKPIAGISGQALIAFAPFIGPFAGPDRIQMWSRLLQSRESVENLIRHIEHESRAKRRKPEAGADAG